MMARRYPATLAIAALAAAAATHAQTAPGGSAAWPGISRTALQRHDLSLAGREMIQVRVDFEPGAAAPAHRHPGEEIVNMLGGSLEYRIEGRPAVTLTAGDVLFIPSGAVHAVRNVGRGKASELATYLVAKDEPLITLEP